MLAQNLERVNCYHQLFVGWNNVAGNPRPFARDFQVTPLARLRRKLCAQPREALHERPHG